MGPQHAQPESESWMRVKQKLLQPFCIERGEDDFSSYMGHIPGLNSFPYLQLELAGALILSLSNSLILGSSWGFKAQLHLVQAL